MDLSYGEAAEAFRAEVRAFLSLHWPPPSDMRGADLRQFIRTFRALAIDQGYLYRAIPKRYGGSGQPVDVIRAQVIREEFVRARAARSEEHTSGLQSIMRLSYAVFCFKNKN